ncbi:MAG TPA: hypothetical protein VE863_23010 [Pyrinomonadaceae bacterium]|jgi:hypothetical protein|nr:hypothetical protein [Pyrinomonadaceae bacterium]
MPRLIIAVVLLLTLAGFLLAGDHLNSSFSSPIQAAVVLQPNSLCAKDERIIFSCPIKRPAKIVSVCASKDLTSERGYIQYRFGLPEKIELEFPKERQDSQQKFQYSHYFRAQVDLTEISFTINGYEYQVTDDYNGEEKPAQRIQGVMVTAPGKPKEVSFVCGTKPKADYADLQAVLPNSSQ